MWQMMRLMSGNFILPLRFFARLLCLAFLLCFSLPAAGLATGLFDDDIAEEDDAISPPPPALTDLQNLTEGAVGGTEAAGLKIREDALKEAALSYGARGGLAYRTYAIQRMLAEKEAELTRLYNFKRLLIPASSGLLIEPPIVSEALRAVLVAGGGQEAAVSDRILKINRAARIVTAARDWRSYLERDWGKVESPPALLLPKNVSERAEWKRLVAEGWDEGVKQAEEIFQADLDLLNADLVGMVRYRELLQQGMISAPFALHEDRGITGGGDELRIGDRGVSITGPAQLNARGGRWLPAPR